MFSVFVFFRVNRGRRVWNLGTWRKSNLTESHYVMWQSELTLVNAHWCGSLVGVDQSARNNQIQQQIKKRLQHYVNVLSRVHIVQLTSPKSGSYKLQLASSFSTTQDWKAFTFCLKTRCRARCALNSKGLLSSGPQGFTISRLKPSGCQLWAARSLITSRWISLSFWCRECWLLT